MLTGALLVVVCIALALSCVTCEPAVRKRDRLSYLTLLEDSSTDEASADHGIAVDSPATAAASTARAAEAGGALAGIVPAPKACAAPSPNVCTMPTSADASPSGMTPAPVRFCGPLLSSPGDGERRRYGGRERGRGRGAA
eukprot:3140182-Prymnesium_polylepis.1